MFLFFVVSMRARLCHRPLATRLPFHTAQAASLREDLEHELEHGQELVDNLDNATGQAGEVRCGVCFAVACAFPSLIQGLGGGALPLEFVRFVATMPSRFTVGIR